MAINTLLQLLKSLPTTDEWAPPLCILKDAEEKNETRGLLLAAGIREARSWKDILVSLASGERVFCELCDPLSKELYDLFVQYGKRPGTLQVTDRASMDIHTVHFSRKSSQLCLLMEERNRELVERDYPLVQTAGLVVRV